ncbi:lytic transglycosylase domain-containing protein [Aurantiacibacter suaedae]|uniref:lytic transglycosylase domain-containing protein n=1 Tax=Aurantiacibacter suaedae TaxID=2545755 RepID=UPI0010F70864|nr:lytic transglycosylase domain-containing protein [Aurantiacibacter suaedae]
MALGLAVTACLGAPAAAQDSRTYFTARITQSDVPQVLSQSDRDYYGALFSAIDGERWGEVEGLLAQRQDGPLHAVARAEYYLAANSPRVEAPQIEAWMQTGRNLPQAEQLARLGERRGVSVPVSLPAKQGFVQQPGQVRRTRPRSVNDGTMPSSLEAAILERITNDDPNGARQLLDGIDASLSSAARAEWRQRVAWSYFIENMDDQSLAMARTVSEGTGEWVAEGQWVEGLASWRLNDCAGALDAFRRSAYNAINPELRTAALYWGARSALLCRQPDLATEMLGQAAANDGTMYGMLAAEQLGRDLPDRVESADFSEADWQQLGGNQNVRIAIALAELGRDILSSEVLLHEAAIGPASNYAALSRLARSLGFPQTQLYMAYNAPVGTSSDPASYFPAPKIAPRGGWQIDPALAFAHILQESNFRASAVSPANAQGLMQITPITVRQHAGCVGQSSGSIDVFEESTNLALGQCNIQMLRDDSAIRGELPKMMAAYNAGLTPVRRWESEVNDQGDPLLYMEAIPYWETRSYVAIVMRNYWMYERQANAPSASRRALAQNVWPQLTTGTAGEERGQTSGRVYFSN